jgi:hypothetical protein
MQRGRADWFRWGKVHGGERRRQPPVFAWDFSSGGPAQGPLVLHEGVGAGPHPRPFERQRISTRFVPSM